MHRREKPTRTEEALAFVDPAKGVTTAEEALEGSRDIMAEWINENQEIREEMRALYFQKGNFIARVVPGMETEGAKYRDYFQWEEAVSGAPSHRVLAMRRGEKEGFINLEIAPPKDDALALLDRLCLKGESKAIRGGQDRCT